MSADEFLAYYYLIYELSCQMYDAALGSRWDDLVTLELQRRQILDTLRQEGGDDIPALTPSDRNQMEALASLIIEQDQKTVPYMQAWMHEISTLLQSQGAETRLRKAYES